MAQIFSTGSKQYKEHWTIVSKLGSINIWHKETNSEHGFDTIKPLPCGGTLIIVHELTRLPLIFSHTVFTKTEQQEIMDRIHEKYYVKD